MNRKAAAICIIAFFAVSGALLWQAANPPASPTQQANFSGQASNAYGESVWFNITATQQWTSSWGSGASASWNVGGTAYTKTHYAHTITISGQQLQPNSGHWKIQFRAGKNTTYYSVRWTSEQSGKTIGTEYTDSYDEQIDTLASALSFSTANTSTTAATFQVYIEIWVTGAVSGTQLYAHSTDWEPFSSNQISYQKIITGSVYGTYYPSGHTMVTGTWSSGWESDLTTDNSVYFWVFTRSPSTSIQLYFLFSGMPAPGSGWYAYLEYQVGDAVATSNWRKVYVHNYNTSVNDLIKDDQTAQSAGIWYSYSWRFDYTSADVDASGNLKIFYDTVVSVGSPDHYQEWDYFRIVVWSVSASWLDDANAVSTLITFLTVLMTFCLVVLEIWRRRHHP